MLVFLDTEFTSLDVPAELLSVALVTEDPEHRLYLERTDFLVENCSQFVVDEVLPLFGRIPNAQAHYDEIGPRTWRWLDALGTSVRLVSDSAIDAQLLLPMLPKPLPTRLRAKPLLIGDLIQRPEFADAEAHSFSATGGWRHHALHDAWALKAGYSALPAAKRRAYAELED